MNPLSQPVVASAQQWRAKAVGRRSFDLQLFDNQFWELVAFVAKAGFFFLLTPIMIKVWGESGYGNFAIAGSSFLFLGLLDFGIRPRLRIMLSQGYRDNHFGTMQLSLKKAIAAQLHVAVVALALILLLAVKGSWHQWFHLREGGDLVIVVTGVCASAYLGSALVLEPLVACGRLGTAKMISALSAVTTVPAVWLVLRWHLPVAVGILTWLGCLIAGNLSGLLFPIAYRNDATDSPRAFKFSLQEGLYFNASGFSWLSKTHLLTLIVAALGGPGKAGIFFVLLRLSEIISNFGAMSSDAAISGLAQARDAAEKRRRFARVVSYAFFFSGQAALAIALVAPPLLKRWWLSSNSFTDGAAIFVGLFGLSMALNRVISCAAFGLGLARSVAIWGTADGVAGILGAILLYPRMELSGILLGSSLGSLWLVPLMIKTFRKISANSMTAVWIEVRETVPWLSASAIVLLLARWIGDLRILLFAAGSVAALSMVWYLRQLKTPRACKPSNGCLAQVANP